VTTISPTLIAARYPLCLDDDTLMCDDELIRYVRNKCGDAVADAITELIYANSIRAQLRETLEEISSAYDAATGAAEAMQDLHSAIESLVNAK
jgi:hypothetical protein